MCAVQMSYKCRTTLHMRNATKLRRNVTFPHTKSNICHQRIYIDTYDIVNLWMNELWYYEDMSIDVLPTAGQNLFVWL